MEVKFTELFNVRCQNRYHVSRGQVRQVVLEPDIVQTVDFDNQVISFFVKKVSKGDSHFYLLTFAKTNGENLDVILAFKVLPELAPDLETPKPLILLQKLVERFGLSMQIGNQFNKFIMSEEIISSDSTLDATEVIDILNPKDHSFINSFFMRTENQKGALVIKCALAFVIDETEYMAWLNGRVFIPARIFLSYTRSDHKLVEDVYSYLKTAGHTPFIDTEDLIGGTNWEKDIFKAIESSDIFVFCISSNSIGRRGMIRLEIKRALEKFDGMLESDIYIIPVRLEKCPYLPELKHLHAVDWFHVQGPKRMLDAIQVAMERRLKT